MKQNSSYKQFSATLIALAVCFIVMFSASFVSAFEFDNVKNSRDITFDGKPILGNKLLERYNPIEIRNLFGLGETLFEIYLSQHDDVCGGDCMSTMEIKLHKDGVLIDDIIFETLQEDNTWIKQSIRSYQFYYWGNVDDYKTQCNIVGQDENGTDVKECSQIKIGSHEDWVRFTTGDEFNKGIYKVRLEGEKKPSRTVDWKIITQGKVIDELAVWGNISLGDDAEVILNSPADDYVAFVNEVQFNCSAEVTGGATLTNMSLWTNESGVFETTSSIVPLINAEGAINDTVTSWNGYDGCSTEIFIQMDGRYANYTKHYGRTSAYHPSALGYGVTTYYYGDTTSSSAQTNFIIDNVWGWITNTNPNPTKNLTQIGFKACGQTGFGEQVTTITNTEITEIILASSYNFVVNRTITVPTLWTCQACDSDGDCGFATENRTLSIDSDAPQITVESPAGTLDYGVIGQEETLNITFNDTNLESCWYDYNGTNITIDGCLNGIKNSTTFTLEENNLNMTLYANDSVGNLNSTFINWSYSYLENNRTHNTQSYETQSESFNINIEGPSSVSLFYNGTEYTTTKSGNNFNRTIQIPISQVGNNSIYWRFNDAVNSYISYQTVNETVFTLCNATYSTTFLNVSFKDEANSNVINASIPASTFDYWLGDGTVKKTYNYINSTDNYNYEFCATPNLELNTDIYIQYKQGSDYPQRIYDAEATALTNTTTNLILYLLGVSDGLYVTFQTFGGQSNALQDVDVTGTRVISGSTTTVAQGTTDAAGTVTFWLNPDFLHTLTFIKTGYETVIETLTPTQTLYTITMGGEAAAGVTNHAEGISITTLPQGSFLDTNTFYTFTYTIDSSILSLDEYGFELFYNNGTSIYSDTDTTSTGGTLDKSFNVTNESRIEMTYYYITNGTRINGTTYWLIYQTNDFSLYHFFDRVSTYIDYNIYGIQGDDEGYFAKAMISILILILVTGTLSMRYGLASDAAVTGLLFGVIFMLNVFNLIPTPDFLTFINLGDFLVFLIALIGIVTIIKEEGR